MISNLSPWRGLGKWLKAAMLLHVRNLYPKVEVVVTENAGSNAPMLAINTKIGFRQYRAGAEYQITREKLGGGEQPDLAPRCPKATAPD